MAQRNAREINMVEPFNQAIKHQNQKYLKCHYFKKAQTFDSSTERLMKAQ